ncbi:MAG: hypothetical protein AUK63_727 [bacterium P3]|nr:MAG: hypothetical protein AUK63_727 [bacterium P3]KWW42210.1 MAG: hypothetical protein F083_549 [bacterium F083]
MKKFLVALVFVAASMALYANPICYFTYSQARRTVNYLNTQKELVIYCGHEYELETYVIVSDVWAERLNARYYEVWLYGIDAYTGEEIYMPIDLSCIWLLDNWSNQIYNAARHLHFQCDAPYTTLVWSMPVYHGFVRVAHPSYYRRTYHYDLHRRGWRPMPDAGLHVYYMRPPSAPMPIVVNSYVPGRERPTVHIDNSVTSRPIPTTSRTASTSTRTSGTQTPAQTGSSRQPSTPASGNRPGRVNPPAAPSSSVNTRTGSSRSNVTPSGNNSGTNGRTGSTSTRNANIPVSAPSGTSRTSSGSAPARQTKASTTASTSRTVATPRTSTTPSRTTTSQPRTATKTTSGNERPASSSTRSGSTQRR